MANAEEKQRFYLEVEKVVNTKDLDWFEAIIYHCSETGMEVETAATLVNDNLRKKVEEVARGRNLLKKESKLPL